MENTDQPTKPKDSTIKVGDVIPVYACQMLDSFFLVKVGDEKMLINKEGVVFFKSRESGQASAFEEQENKLMASLMSNGHYGQSGREEIVELTCQPGSEAYVQANKIVQVFLGHFIDRLRNEFRIICIKFSQMINDSGRPLMRYLARERGGLPGLKAHLIREFFTHTTVDERGLNILFFLTNVIAMNEDGTLAEQNLLTPKQQKEILIDFLDYVRDLGADAEKKEIFQKTYRDFIDQEYELLLKEGGAGFYINSSFLKAMKTQKDFLFKESNKNYLETAFRSAVRTQCEFVIINMLSYLKGLVVLRLHSHSKKEQRGRNDDEREKILYDIIAYQKK